MQSVYFLMCVCFWLCMVLTAAQVGFSARASHHSGCSSEHWSRHVGFSSWGSWSPEYRPSSCGAQALLLCGR